MNYVKGDLLSVTSGIIAHGCNCQGVMGSGVALAIKNKYPGAYEEYVHCYRDRGLGGVIWYRIKTLDNRVHGLYIANLLTQEKYGRDGERYVDYDALKKSFTDMLRSSASLPVAIPKIGAGFGGGDWKIISSIIEQCCLDTGYNSDNITVYELE